MVDTKHYLKELKKKLGNYIGQIKSLKNKDGFKKLNALLQEVADDENELRKTCEIGARYNVVRNQIQALIDEHSGKEKIKKPQDTKVKNQEKNQLKADEQRVYVYLFNVQGGDITSWHKLLLPSSLSEHSVNRPIYVEESQLKRILTTKQNTSQHAYLVAIINKNDIIRQYNLDTGTLIDGQGHKLLRLKDGALIPEKIEYFWHDGKQYRVSKDGYLSPYTT